MQLSIAGGGTSKSKDHYESNTPQARESYSVSHFKHIFLLYHRADRLINPESHLIIKTQTINYVSQEF